VRYPTISRQALLELAPVKLSQGSCSHDAATVWKGKGEDLDLDLLVAMASQLEEAHASFLEGPEASDRDLFEGRAAAIVHSALSDLPLLVLDDPGFWRYLALVHTWDYTVWRESKTFESEYAKYRKYIDGVQPSECVILRTYLRGQIALEDGEYELAWAIPKGTDFWRSHIIRVRTGTTPAVARAFVREQLSDRMTSGPLRAYARRLNRLRTNVVLEIYDDDDAEKFCAHLRTN
jgi:hypothetical protein